MLSCILYFLEGPRTSPVIQCSKWKDPTSSRLPISSCSTEIDVLLPVMLDSPYPLKKARADTCFGMVLPKDVKHQIELACFANGSMAYTRSLRCMDTQGPAFVLGTFFAEWKRNSTSSDASRQAVYYGCAMQALRRILKLPVRPLYGMVFEKGVLHLAAMTIDSADNSYVVLSVP